MTEESKAIPHINYFSLKKMSSSYTVSITAILIYVKLVSPKSKHHTKYLVIVFLRMHYNIQEIQLVMAACLGMIEITHVKS